MTVIENQTERKLTPDELRTLFLFEALNPEQLDWLAEHGTVETHAAGSPVYREGEPATCFFVLLAGTLSMHRDVDGTDVELNRSDYRGSYSGATRAWLTSSTEETYVGSMTAVTECDFLVFDAPEIGDKLREWFPMAIHLLEGLYLGLRNSESLVGQRQRLTALGRLTAGLTHELNNPAAAAVRATATLRERWAGMRHKLAGLASGKLDPEVLMCLSGLQEEAIEKAAKAPDLTPLQASDLEDEITDWFDDRGITNGWQMASVYAAGSLGAEWLDDVASKVPERHLESGLRWIAYSLESEQLMGEIEDSTTRISQLVEAAKQYSQLDRAENQLADLHIGLKSTLTMLGTKLSGLTLEKDFDRSLPRVPIFAAELNQVWTNIIDNAVQAMHGDGTLSLRTYPDGEYACVEIGNTGPQIPPDIQKKIFEPFFTTKPVGEGTGLGLDISYRIVTQRHRGDIRVASTPEKTTFTVCLPLGDEREPAPAE
ncbi:ATP-binding protein [Spongisporangium articulatum]|uniref:histidine kinase n=1 Tax=Spongisporangium articulatum TaxID=3362603 RepID=A0ABW8AH46_9ACTN